MLKRWFCLILYLLCAVLYVSSDVLDIPIYHDTANVRDTLKTSSLLLALNPTGYDILLNIQELFQNLSLRVGVWDSESTDQIVWLTETRRSDESNNFAFYKQDVKSRNCLIQPSFLLTVRAHEIPGNHFSLVNVVEFINDQLFAFVTLDGSLSKAGQVRQNILDNFFEVPKKSKDFLATSKKHSKYLCERISVPNTEDFLRNYLFRSKPVIIENAISNWPALNKWSNDFLRRKYGDKKVHVKLTPTGEFEGCDHASRFDNYDTFKIPKTIRDQLPFPDLVVVRPAVANVPFSKFLDMVENRNGAYNFSAYLEYSSIREYFPELKDDITEFPFIADLLDLSNLNIWLSNGKTLGKLHFDPFDNILCQLRGRKKLTLYAPHHNSNLYEGHIQEGLLNFNENTQKFRYSKLLDSTSMVMSPVDILNPNNDRFPNFTRAEPMECVLNEGDILFMPSFWWHEVQSYPNKIEQRNLAINFWYEPFLTKDFPCPDCKMDVNPMYRKLLDLF